LDFYEPPIEELAVVHYYTYYTWATACPISLLFEDSCSNDMATQSQFVTIPAVVVRYTTIVPHMYLEKGLDDGIWKSIRQAHDKSYSHATRVALCKDIMFGIIGGCLCHSCFLDKAYKDQMNM
jgi:uncharacterized membrane protein YbjE (DUF340 family)